MKLTWNQNRSYTGWRKMIGGKLRYLGRDRDEAERKAEDIISKLKGGQPSCKKEESLTTHEAVQQYERYVDGAAITQTWRATLKWRLCFLKNYLPVVQFSNFGYDELTSVVNKLMARPVGRRKRQISAQSVLNLLQVLRQFLGWAEVSGRWMPPATLRRWETLLKPSGKLTNQANYNQIQSIPLATWAKLYVHAQPQMQAVLLCALNFGATQTEAATMSKSMLDFKTMHVCRHRHKTGVFTRWAIWTRTAEAIRKVMPADSESVFVGKHGKPLIHYSERHKTDTVAQQWRRLLKKAEVTGLGFKHCRKLGGQLVREVSDLDTARVFLSHTTGSVAERHYVNPSWVKLDEALRVIEGQVETAILAAQAEREQDVRKQDSVRKTKQKEGVVPLLAPVPRS